MDDSEERQQRLKAKMMRGSSAGQPSPDVEHEARLLEKIKVGDICFVCDVSQGDEAWYRARLVGTRTRDPRIHVELLATMDARKHKLPTPCRRHVHWL